MTRGRLVVGNWKSNPASIADADARRGTDIGVYAQDVHWEAAGAYTGQVSVAMLRGLAAGAIVGHSEVRRDQGDDDARVARKLARVLSAGLRGVLCVGETEAQFAADETEAVLKRQIERDLEGVRGATPDRFVVAYEPVWA